MKKFICCILIVVMLLTLVSCSNQEAKVQCLNCDALMDVDDKFCPSCGANAQPSASGTTDGSDDTQQGSNEKNEIAEIKVSTAQEFLSAIGSNKKIILSASSYNLSYVSNVSNDNVSKGTGEGYIISGVSNLTISGSADIIINDLFSNVLEFSNCKNLTISGITAGHNNSGETYQCEGDVIELDGCTDVVIENCKLFGCGATGLSANRSKNVVLKLTDIYDCSYSAINAWDSQIEANNCNFYEMHTFGGVLVSNSSVLKINNSTIENNSSGIFVNCDSSSVITIDNCVVEGNTFESLYSNEGKLKFNSCSITDNTGELQESSTIYQNCTFSNNSSNPVITIEYIDWDINSASGVEPIIKYKNNSEKQIAYIYFYVQFFDRMGYPAYCSIKDSDTQSLKVVGPIEAGAVKTAYWDPVIYNSAVGAAKPLYIEVKFTDGTSRRIENTTGQYWYSSTYYGGELHD